MIPQLEQINNCTTEEKAVLVHKGLAIIGVAGDIYLSLPAVNQLGMHVVNNNPLVQVGKELADNHVVCTAAVEPLAANAAMLKTMVHELYRIMNTAAYSGYPLYAAFNRYMATPAPERQALNFLSELEAWKQQIEQMQAAKQAEAGQTQVN